MATGSEVTIQFVTEQGLCSGCGTCSAACPAGSITVNENHCGLLVAEVDQQKCTLCGICTRICPAIHPPPVPSEPGTDPFAGRTMACYCGYASNSRLCGNGQSGGLTTALVSYLLERGGMDNALLTGDTADPLRPGPVIAGAETDLQPFQSSRYLPVSLNSILDKVDDFSKLVCVGLGCHIAGLHNYISMNGRGRGKPLTIGLFCDSVMSNRAVAAITGRLGEKSSDISHFRFKDKRYGAFPGNSVVKFSGGGIEEVPGYRRVFMKNLLKPPYCYMCFDKLNVLADISVGDAWGLGKEKLGSTVVVCRTGRGNDIVENAAATGYVRIDPVSCSKIVAGQNIASRKAVWYTSLAIWKEKGRHVPDYGLDIPSEFKKGRKAQRRFERSLKLFSASTAAGFDRRLSLLMKKEFVPFVVRETAGRLLNMALSLKGKTVSG